MPKLILGGIFLLALALAGACGGGGGSGSGGAGLTGTWDLLSRSGQPVPVSYYLTLNEDGTGSWRTLDTLSRVAGTWSRSGNLLTLTTGGGSVTRWYISRLTSTQLQLSNQAGTSTDIYRRSG